MCIGFLRRKKSQSEHDAFQRTVYERHGIPPKDFLQEMPDEDLALNMEKSRKDSAEYLVYDREMKRRVATDAAKIARQNILYGAMIGGCFGIVGSVIGAVTKLWIR